MGHIQTPPCGDHPIRISASGLGATLKIKPLLSVLHISVIVYIDLTKSIPAEALDTHTMDEQSLAKADKLQPVMRVQETGPRMLHDGSFARRSSWWVSVVSGWVFHGVCQLQICSG